MQNNYNKLMNNLESLNLNMFKANLSTYLEYMENGSKKLAIIVSKLWPLIPKLAKSHKTRPAGAAITIALPKYK